MARTVVVTGGTKGIGRAFALRRIERGDAVVVVGSAARPADLPGADVVRADLSTVAGTRELAARLAREHPVIDVLWLGAHRIHQRRTDTAEGLETTFALYYLSRHVLAHALADAVAGGIVVSLSGPGITRGAIRWDDPQLTRGWSALRANLQAGRANDLLGVSYVQRRPGTRFAVVSPGFTDTRPYTGMRQPWRALSHAAAAVAAAPPERSAAALDALVSAPPAEPFTAWTRRRDRMVRLDPDLPTFDPATAARLDALTAEVLAGIDAGVTTRSPAAPSDRRPSGA